MPKQKKTWAESHDFKPGKNDGLLIYLQFALHKTCRRLGWDWSLDRETETFCKLYAFLPAMKRGGYHLVIFFDLETRAKLFRCVIEADVFILKDNIIDYRADAEAFKDALQEAIGKELQYWLEKHPEDTNKIDYLLGRTPGEKPKPEKQTEVIKQTQEVKDNLNRELERESRRKVVAKANKMKLDDAKRAWTDIAKELELPERTLRDWRHNPHYQTAENGK